MKIESIKLIDKDGKEFEMSLDDAKELYGQLDTLFGSKTTYMPSLPNYILDQRIIGGGCVRPWKQEITYGGGVG